MAANGHVYCSPVIAVTPVPAQVCSDGTAIGVCSSQLPLYCNSVKQLVSDAVRCGCPAGMAANGKSFCSAVIAVTPVAAQVCSDGTAIGVCSSQLPLYCNSVKQLVSDAVRCGCPAGMAANGHVYCSPVIAVTPVAAQVCSDGTGIGVCSSQLPLYCNSVKQLVSDAVRCGCPAGMAANGKSFCSAVVAVTPVAAQVCSDGTGIGVCSSQLPLYCNSVRQLVADAPRCGCPAGLVSNGKDMCVKAPVAKPAPAPFNPGKIVDDIVATIRGFKFW